MWNIPAVLGGLVAKNASEFPPGFHGWLMDNWPLWLRFEAEATRVWDRRVASCKPGKIPHYSARTILEVLRHESAVSDTGTPWKINDHATPDLARLYMLFHPQRAGFFELRERKIALGVAA